ncbi:MAG TPA: ATP-dependent DNA helicase [Actinomycetota bacterium]
MTSARFPPEIVEAMGAVPTDEQWTAISMPLEPYVIVAGAGSGKTSVIAARVVYLALVALGRVPADHQGVLPGNVLCLTFTNKATENLMLRVRRALSAVDLPEGEEPAVLNYHAFAGQVIERYGLLANIETGQRILSGAQRSELCARVLDRMAFEHVRAEWQPSVIDKILTLADQMANHRVTPEQVVAFNEARLEELAQYRSDRAYQAAQERIELARAVRLFQDLKQGLRAIDFGDQITLALDLVERYPQIARDYRSRFHTAVLDEYQDTNVAQAQLISAVFGAGFPVAAVGDPDQNIYAWRGASLFNLLEFPTAFPRADGAPAAKLPLYTNFRSGAAILAAADEVIDPLPSSQRPDPEKRLVPWKERGEGEVALSRVDDEWTEACRIADRIVELHGKDPANNPWSSFAVLCRKSRLFTPVERAFAEAGIPVEIVGLAGLLKLPEVVEILAYAKAVADPYASVSLARILLGPRYRVGFKDLARVAAWAKDRNLVLRDADDDETAPFLFAEAFEHLDEVTFLSEEGTIRLEEFRRELAGLRAEAGRPVGEFLAEVIRRTGLLGELEAGDDAFARSVKRNLAAFLDEVHAFSPLEGELTLRAFLDYVEAVEASDRPEWSPVQPSEEDSVKVMTIHQAKGLEFDTVFVPGFAKGLLPDVRVQHNPAESGKSLDFELRGDASILPRFGGVLSRFHEALRGQAEIEERRACYVGLTRARDRLFVSGAHWYGDGQTVKEPSAFFEELADWGEASGRASVDRGAEPPESNPLAGYRERFVRDWPGPATRAEPDELFTDGWRRAAARAAEEGGGQGSLIDALGPEERAAYERAAERSRQLAAEVTAREVEPPGRARLPQTVSVGGLVDYARCPKVFFWSYIRPLPRFSGPAARIGSQIHAWIERRSSGQASLLELDESPDLTADELSGEPGRTERLQQGFLASRFADRVPLHAERPFLLHVDGFVVSGRIDAIFGTADSSWEVVDYKTGRVPDPEDAISRLQLDVYALACMEVWRKAPEELTLTYLYLGTDPVTEVSREAGDLEGTRRRVVETLSAMAEGRFDPTPGPQCRWCDFLSFCDAGQAFLKDRA